MNIAYCQELDYANKYLGVTLSIPNGAQITEGNPIRPLTSEEESAFKEVFNSDAESLKEALKKTIFTLGYYSGAIKEGADGSISATATPVKSNGENHAKKAAHALIYAEEKENKEMSFSFTEKAREIIISGIVFYVSKGDLKILQNKNVIFKMPIYFYIAEFNSLVVTFIISGNEEKVHILESTLLDMVIH